MRFFVGKDSFGVIELRKLLCADCAFGRRFACKKQCLKRRKR